MTQPSAYTPSNNFATEVGEPWGLHLDTELSTIASVIAQIEANLAIIQRDDTLLRNQTVGANTFGTDALALIAGVQGTSTRWVPRGFWATATLYNATDIIETGAPAIAYVCVTQHTSGTFATDHAAGKWVILSQARTLVQSDITGALGFTPVNKAGDTMTGALSAPSGSSISGLTFADTLLAAQDLVTINKGLYSAYASAAADQIYGFAANVVRTGGTSGTVGSQTSGISNQSGTIWGANNNAIGLSGASGPLVAHEADAACYESSNTQPKVGYNAVFANRSGTNPGQYNYVLPSGTYTSPGAGIGGNLYNRLAWAFWLSSQQRSASGEFCGWTRGLIFDEYSLDSENDATFSGSRAYPIGVDFSKIHYYGGSNPVTAFNLEAAIAFRDLQGILWNRDPAAPGAQLNKIRTHFNPFIQRWVLTNAGNERFGIDVTNGNVYVNGALFSGGGGASLTGNNTWTIAGTNIFQGPVTMQVNVTYSGAGRRLLGPMSTLTFTDRLIAQTTDANSDTEWGVIPSGTSTAAGLYAIADSAAANGVVGRLGVDTTGVLISSGFIGAGAYKPLDFATGGSVQVRLNELGQVMIGTTTPPASGVKLRVAGIIQFDNAVAFSVNRNGVAQTIPSGVFTQVAWTTKEFDQNTSFSTGTSRFTPPAGTYALSACINYQGTVDQKRYATIIYKNGAALKNNSLLASGTDSLGTSVTCVVQANGTDFFEVYTWHNSGVNEDITGLTTDCWFSGTKIA